MVQTLLQLPIVQLKIKIKIDIHIQINHYPLVGNNALTEMEEFILLIIPIEEQLGMILEQEDLLEVMEGIILFNKKKKLFLIDF